MNTIEYMPIQNVSTNAGIFGDVANHCKNWKYFAGNGSKITAVHEMTHGVNSQLRSGRTNGFYLLGNRAVKLEEPATKKSDCIKHIPMEMRYGRFNTYIKGQREWENSPLYVFDEWVAYLNGAKYMVVESSPEGKGTDYIFGPIEFCAYGVATAMAASRADITEFTRHMVQESVSIYLKGKDKFPWETADECYGQLTKNFKDYMEVPNAWAL